MKLWGGRFTKDTDSLVEDFHSSISFDKRLYRQDIRGSMAHARMLGETGIIAREDAENIIRGLQQILADLEAGRGELSVHAEDIHMNVEQLLIERVGEVGKKLHTARSRNDQVALDTRMFLKEEIVEISELLIKTQQALVELAEQHTDTVMPGYTHLQKAQPITFAHHLMAYFEMFQRDWQRLRDCYGRTDVCPLGSGALAGTTFPIDREMVAEELGFNRISTNSLDGVSDRDYVIEFAAAASLIMTHLSRLCEEIILWASDEFSFINLDDAYSTGSSIMPQKKNPDVAELVRGKSGRVYGHLMALLTMVKGLPLAYNKDLQEDKEALFDIIDTVKKSLLVFAPMIATITVNTGRMYQGAGGGFTNATDVADYLVNKGMGFRDAHRIVGELVFYAIEQEKELEKLTLAEYRQFADMFEEDIFQAIAISTCVERRNVPGGPAPVRVKEAVAQAKVVMETNSKEYNDKN
ncbi:argininosuccinate lyase [Metallumcola ferriviriculae]|uniref:Argininosuccinate lyase n=1 Tax=Metallumcola ferriviriculae TaxID=3039180 RepID=A0AAU0UIA5_9FIRM|nr:argininosuccinate lyase [Desulfitibacteraceae bacterium MK1]